MTTKTTKSRQTPVKGATAASRSRTVVEPVGVLEASERLGVASDTVQKWRTRFADTDLPFPEPRGLVGGNPWWHYGDVLRWAKKTGRA